MLFGGYTVILHFTSTKHHRKGRNASAESAVFDFCWNENLPTLRPWWHMIGNGCCTGPFLSGVHCLMMAAPSTLEKEPISLSSSTYSPFIQSERVLQMSRLARWFSELVFCCVGEISSLIIRQQITVASFGVVFSCQCWRDGRTFGKEVDEGSVCQYVLHPSDSTNSPDYNITHHEHLQPGLQSKWAQ